MIKFAANNVKELSELEVLKGLADLKNLDLAGNPVADLDGYREKVFEMFPELVVLDNQTLEGEEYISEDEEDDDYGDEEGDAPNDAEGDEDELDEEAEYDDEEEGEYDDEDYGEEDSVSDAELGKRKK